MANSNLLKPDTGTFLGGLNSNEFLNGLFNAYGLVYTYGNNLGGRGDSLAERFKADGGQYRDQLVYTDVDVLYSRIWDKADTNVLATENKGMYTQQYISVDSFRQIGLTVDQFLTKRAWMDAGKYDEFRTVILKQINDTKQVYEDTLVDTFVGVHVSKADAANITVTMPTDDDAEKQNRLRAMEVFKTIGDTFNSLADYNRSFNENKYLKRFSEGDCMLVFSDKYANEFRYVDTPTVFHKEDLLAKGKILNRKYFGSPIDSGVTTADGNTHRAVENMLITISSSSGEYKAPASGANAVVQVFPGDLLPKGTPLTTEEATYNANVTVYFTGLGGSNMGKAFTASVCTKANAYVEDNKIICKIIHKDAVKYLSSITTQTEFVNGKNHTQNMYLTWGYSYPAALKGYPFITVAADA